MAVAKKKPVTEAGGLPYSADTVNAYIRHANAKLGVMSNTTIRLPMTTGTLSIDLLLFGGPSGGKFMTSFGPEKAFKTTTMTECLVWYIAQEIKWRRYIAANPEASRPPPITLVYWDYENSLHTSDSGAIFSMLRKWVPDVRRVEVFGDDANLPAVYVYSEIPDLETMFEHIELLSEAIPPMAMINGRWFWKMESLPAGVPRDEGVSKLTGVPCVPAPQPIPAQVLVFTDSIPAMAPRAGIGPDKSAAMALQARSFSQALTTTQNYRVSRRMMVWAANQLRERPASGNANPNYEVGGNALRYFSDVRMSHSPQAYKTFSPPSHMPQLDKEQRCYESTWNGAGQDTYSFLKITTTKNKLDGARDQLSIKLRVWATTNGASQLGIDPVYDVYQALEMMSLMEKKVGDNYRVLAFGLENAAKGMTWQQLKTLVLFRFESDEMYNAVVAIFNDLRLPESLEPFNLRDAVYDLIHHGDGVNRWSTNVFGYEDTSVTDDMVAVEGDTPDQAAAYAKVAPSGYPVVAR